MNKIKSAIIAVFLSAFAFSIYAGQPSITGVIMSPANPNFGDAVQITVTYCGQLSDYHMIAIAFSNSSAMQNADLSGIGQVFVVSRAGIDVATSQPALVPNGEISFEAQAFPGAVPPDCMTCGSGSNDGKQFVKIYNVHMPSADYFPGCDISQLYLHVGMKDGSMLAGEWTSLAACQRYSSAGYPAPTIGKGFSISKRAEGVLQAQNDYLLFSADYEYYNGQLVITDSIPGGGNFSLVSYGPQAIAAGPAIGATSGTLSWTLPDRSALPGKAAGTVWMLLRMSSALAPGTNVMSTATGAMSGVSSQNASAAVIVGPAAVSIVKSQDNSVKNLGDTVTYFLDYQVGGSKLAAYQSFDEITLAVYGNASGTGGAAVPGWTFRPDGGVEGAWTVSEPCNTADRVITGDTNVMDKYPMLLFDGMPAGNNMCKGIVMADVSISPGGNAGADAMVVLRSDGQAVNNFYGLVLSVDDFIGTNSTGNIGFVRCVGSACDWPMSTNTVSITGNKWWRTKTELAPPSANNQYSFRSKVWAKGDPEPAMWTITWTDVAPVAALNCNNGQTWKPGIGEQQGSAGDVKDSYNNFMVYEPRVSSSTTIWDTIPAGISYIGQSGPYPMTSGAPVLSWILGTISEETGTFTWRGMVTMCGPITNEASIKDAVVVNKSNSVTLNVLGCPTAAPSTTFTRTFTPTVTATFATTFTVTRTVTPTNTQFPGGSATFTPTRTLTPSFTTTTGGTSTVTRTVTPSITASRTFTPFAGTAVFTASPTVTSTIITGPPGIYLMVNASTAYTCNSSNAMNYDFYVYNNGPSAVPVNTLEIRFWYKSVVNGPANYNMSIYDQRTSDLQVAIGTTTSWTVNSFCPDATIQASMTFTGSALIPANGFLKISGAAHLISWATLDPECDDYSNIGATTPHWDPNFGLYQSGFPVNQPVYGYAAAPCSIPSPTATYTATYTPTITVTPNDFTIATVVVNPLPGDNGGRNQCVDSNGNILVVALEWDGACTCYVTVIYRYLPDGRLDTSFGTGGRMVCPGPQVHYSWEDSMTIKCDSMGRIVVAGYSDTCGGTCADVIIYRFLQDGSPDNTFNGGQCWRTYNNLAGGNGNDYVYDFDFDENGKMVCTGKSWNGTDYDAIIFRCNADGSPDTTFGPGGCRKINKCYGRKIKCTGGKIYITGESDSTDPGCTGTCKSMCVWKYNADGTPDVTFTSPCYINTAIGHSNCRAKSIVITISGKIVVTGTVDDGSGCTITCKRMVIMVYNPDGTPDTTFNGTGMLTDVSGTDGSYVMEVDGKIVVCFIRHNGTDTDCVVRRYNMDGTVDTTFDGDGEMVYDSGSDDECYSILRLTICRLIAAGHTYNVATGYDMILWNIEDMCPPHTPTATFTPTFTTTSSPTLTMTRTFTSTIMPSFTATVTRTHTPVSTSTLYPSKTATPLASPACVMLDLAFNGNGIVMSDFSGGGLDAATSMVRDSSGNYVIAGRSGSSLGVWRYLPNGTLDSSFNAVGYVKVSSLAGVVTVMDSNYPTEVKIDSLNRIVVVGYSANLEGFNDMVILRFNSDGSPDTSFNSTGRIIYHVPGVPSHASGMTFDTAGKLLITGSVNFNSTIFRFNSNGSLDTSFNGTGSIVTAGGTSRSIVVDAAGKIVVDMHTGTTGEVWRFNSDGSTDSTFNRPLLWNWPPGGTVHKLVIDSLGRIIGAGDYGLYGVIFRLDSNGTFDTSFNGTGITSESFGFTSITTYYDLNVGSDGRITGTGTGFKFSQNSVMIFRFNENGSPDTGFNTTGCLAFEGPKEAFSTGLVVDPSGRIVISGAAYMLNSQNDLLLAAFTDNCAVPSATSTRTATYTRTSTPTCTPTVTPSFTFTRTVTVTQTFIITPTFTPTISCGFVATPVFNVEMIFNPESSDNDIFNITSNTALASAPGLKVHPHGQCANKPVLTLPSALIPTETMKYRVLYPKQTGYGDVDYVEVIYADACGATGTAVVQFEKSVISQKDVQLFKNVINPDGGERCRISFKTYGGDHITVKIYTRNGVLIKTIFDSDVTGTKWMETMWDGTNAQNEKVVSGVYYVVVDSDFYTIKEKIAVTR